MIDAVFVPRGLEERAVRRGLGRGGREIAVYPTAIGSSSADMVDAMLVGGSVPRFALVTGLCGALDPAFCVGEVLLYASILAGHNPSAETATIATDSELTLRLQRAIRGAQSGVRGITVENAITRPNDKRLLAAASGAHAVDMESFALVSRLREAGVSVAVLRVVSDGASDELPDLKDALTGPGLSLSRLAASIVRKPLGGLRLIAGGTRALRALRNAFRAISTAGVAAR